MDNAGINAELLRSLRKLARGLSALFWGLPVAPIICAETARVDALRPFGIVPAIVVNALLVYGIWQMDDFQRQERPWRNALDRAKLLAIINLGLCPFLFWFSRMPEQFYFQVVVSVLVLTGLIFLFNLNAVLRQLGAMLPDETLRHDIRQFTLLNRWLLVFWMVCAVGIIVVSQLVDLSAVLNARNLFLVSRASVAVLLFLALSPLAITMALIWKTKEVILDSVFGVRQ